MRFRLCVCIGQNSSLFWCIYQQQHIIFKKKREIKNTHSMLKYLQVCLKSWRSLGYPLNSAVMLGVIFCNVISDSLRTAVDLETETLFEKPQFRNKNHNLGINLKRNAKENRIKCYYFKPFCTSTSMYQQKVQRCANFDNFPDSLGRNFFSWLLLRLPQSLQGP